MKFSQSRQWILAALFCLVLIPNGKAVVVYIDTFTTANAVSADNQTVTNTFASAGAVGGFRTMILTSTNESGFGSVLRTSTSAPLGGRLMLDTGSEATAPFTVKWGGTGGTVGLGGVDFRGGIADTNFSLGLSTLNFLLRNSDKPNNSFTWTFTDTNNVVATYGSTFPQFSPTIPNPSIAYAISLASFTGSGLINWGAIDFITFSAGGLDSLDATYLGPFSVNAQAIPEPGTWAAAGLLVLAAGYIRWRRSRSATAEDAPAAA